MDSLVARTSVCTVNYTNMSCVVYYSWEWGSGVSRQSHSFLALSVAYPLTISDISVREILNSKVVMNIDISVNITLAINITYNSVIPIQI